MPAKVLNVKADHFTGSDGDEVKCWKVEVDDRTQPVPCYDARAADLKVGEPLPEGWEVKKSKKDKDYLAAPKAGGKGGGGFAVAWKNTKEGFEAEQAMWARKQFIEEQARDRRTALMQAIAALSSQIETFERAVEEMPTLSVVANEMYEWLRETSGSLPAGAVPAAGVGPSPGAGGGTSKDPKPANVGGGGGHTVDSPGKGSMAQGQGDTPPPSASTPGVGVDSGEGVAPAPVAEAEGTGEGRGGSAPVSKAACTHEHTTPLKPDGTEMPISKVRCLDCNKAIPASQAKL